jgi:hypothetical protein
MSLKATLSARQSSVQSNVSMYSAEGASFQEWALSRIDFKGSVAHQSIGRLVTDINNKNISVADAKNDFLSKLNS